MHINQSPHQKIKVQMRNLVFTHLNYAVFTLGKFLHAMASNVHTQKA